MKVAELRERLEDMLDVLDYYDDEQEVVVRSNTYGMGMNFLAVPRGFVDFDDIELEEDEYEDEYEDEF